LVKCIKKNGGEHVSYDPVKELWMFKVFHWTKYGIDEDEDMEEEPEESK